MDVCAFFVPRDCRVNQGSLTVFLEKMLMDGYLQKSTNGRATSTQNWMSTTLDDDHTGRAGPAGSNDGEDGDLMRVMS